MNERVSGAIRYAIDVERPGMLHARLVRAPLAPARVTRVAAADVPADAVVLLPEDVAGLGRYGCIIRDQDVLPQGVVRHVGEPVAAVACADERAARAAAALIEVGYDDLPGVYEPADALAGGAPLVHDLTALEHAADLRPDAGTNACHRFRLLHGRGEAGLEEADVVVEGEWTCAGAQHSPMEPHACTAEWQDGRLTVWTGTQTPFNVRSELAGVFGLAPEDVRVIVPPMGGSFGAKTFCRLEPIVAALARKAGRPVRAVLDRDEVFVTLNRHPARFRVRLGARADGTFVGRRVWAWWDTGAYADTGPNVAAKGGWAAIGPYRFDHVEVDSVCVYTHRPPNGAYRGYAATQAVWASEQAVDLLAERLGADPLDLRLQNLLREGEAFATGEVLHDFRVAECLQDVAERIGWRQDRRGKGLCALMKGMQTPSRCGAAIELVDGAFVVRSATTEIGQGAVIALPALAAAALGVEREAVTIGPVDTDLVPFDTRTTSSRSTHMMAGALGRAAVELRARIAEALEAAPGDVELGDGHAGVRGVPARRVPLADLGPLRGDGEWHVDGGLDPDTGHGIASAHWHQGAGAVEVRVDEETGVVEIVQLAASVYAGQVVEPVRAELQNEGSLVMGVGSALFEAIDFAGGQIANANLSDYALPTFADVPPLDHVLLEREGAEVHGLGETALPLVPAAVGNALRALGLAQTHMPVHAERVLDAVDARAERPA